jgi:putative FmdB family regulatory protein
VPLYDFKCAEGHRFERFVALVDFASPQACGCGAPTQRLITAPMIARSDSIAPIMGADGKMHDSLSSYRATLKPEGNPRGERFHELGDTELPAFKAPEFDRKTRREAIKAGIADVKAGRIPPVVTGDIA